MPELDTATGGPNEPMIVQAHATPWGFLLALPFALALSFLGASLLDADLANHPLSELGGESVAALGLLLIGFALYLFLIGVGELAGYLKPAVEMIVDDEGVAVFGLLGERRLAWRDLIQVRVVGDALILKARARTRPRVRNLRLSLRRLAVDPRDLLRRLQSHRPDLPLRIST